MLNSHVEKADLIFEKFLHSRGLRYTRERKIVVRAIMKIEGHFSLEKLLRKVKKDEIHRATVYRMLPLLVEGNIIRRSPSGKAGVWNYEHLVEHEHHDHFLCLRCGKIMEFKSMVIEDEQNRLCRQYGFQELNHQLCIRGVCRNCRQKRKKKK